MTLYEDLTAGRQTLEQYAGDPLLARGVSHTLDAYWRQPTPGDQRSLDGLLADRDGSISQYHAMRRGAVAGAVATVGTSAGFMHLPGLRSPPAQTSAYLALTTTMAAAVFWQLARTQCRYVKDRLAQRAKAIDENIGRLR